MASERSKGLAAQAWCTVATKHYDVNYRLLEAFADILDRELAERATAPAPTEKDVSMQTIGTCGTCGGPVQTPTYWGADTPPPQRCARCGAEPANQYGPVIPMKPALPKGYTVSENFKRKYLMKIHKNEMPYIRQTFECQENSDDQP